MPTDFNHKFPQGGKSSHRMGSNPSGEIPTQGKPKSNVPEKEFPKKGESNDRSPPPPHSGDRKD